MHLRTRSRRILAAAVVAAAVAPASAAQAQAPEAVCDTGLGRLEAQFYDMADRRSYEDASDWWQARWQAYHASCVV